MYAYGTTPSRAAQDSVKKILSKFSTVRGRERNNDENSKRKPDDDENNQVTVTVACDGSDGGGCNHDDLDDGTHKSRTMHAFIGTMQSRRQSFWHVAFHSAIPSHTSNAVRKKLALASHASATLVLAGVPPRGRLHRTAPSHTRQFPQRSLLAVDPSPSRLFSHTAVSATHPSRN